jgi:hypothetical protein
LRGELLAAQIILMADRGLSPAEISAAFCDQGLTRPIRPGLSKPLITPAVVEGTLASWRSSRELGLSISQRLRYAALCRPFASPEELPSPEELEPVLQRQFAELVARCGNEPGRVDYVPPQEPAAEHQTPPGAAVRHPEEPGLSDARTEAAANQHGPPPEKTAEPVILDGPDDPVFVWGKEKDPLTPDQYRVVKALVEVHAKKKRLSQDVLRLATIDADGNVVEDPLGVLKRLRRDDDWKNAIDMAGKPRRGYGLKDKPPTPTQRNRQPHPRRPRGG